VVQSNPEARYPRRVQRSLLVVLLGPCLGPLLGFAACGGVERDQATLVRAPRGASATVLDAASDAATDADTVPDADTGMPDTGAPDSAPDADSAAPGSDIISDIDDAVLDSIDSVDAAEVADSHDADAAGPDDAACRVGARTGTCRHVADCEPGEAALEGFCDGGPQVRCCLPALDRCSASRAPGACITVADCPAPDWTSTSGLCPGAADIRCCTASTAPPLCDPAVLPTPNDGLVEEPGDPGCPAGMAYVPAEPAPGDFCMDRFEASLVLAADPSVSLSPYHPPGQALARAVSLRWGVPQGNIDEVRAAAACGRAGKRLCTSDEWLAACRGPSDWTYPYGPDRIPGRCNDARKTHVAVEYFGTNASWIFSEIDNPCLAQLPASLDLAGENPGCVTANGVFDLMGNLHEWVDDAAGTFRGGFFSDTSINGNGCLYRTTAHDVSHHDYSTGFRCCADPAP
jgi:hypothetical protein